MPLAVKLTSTKNVGQWIAKKERIYFCYLFF